LAPAGIQTSNHPAGGLVTATTLYRLRSLFYNLKNIWHRFHVRSSSLYSLPSLLVRPPSYIPNIPFKPLLEQLLTILLNVPHLYIYINLVVCLTTGPKPLPKRTPHVVRSRASSNKSQCPLFSLRSSNSFLRLLRRHPVTSIPPCIFPSITRSRRQFLRKM